MKFLIPLLFIATASAGPLKVVTTEFPPYQYIKNQMIDGVATEIVKEVIKTAHLKADIKVYPWARAYKIAQREPDVIIYSIGKTPEREKLFKWIGTIVPYNVYFWRLHDRKDIRINSLVEAKKYIAGGVVDDIKALELQKMGFESGKNLELVGSDETNIKKLFAGRIDIMPYDELSFPYRVSMAGHDFSRLVRLIQIDSISHDLYVAASLQTSDDIVKKLQDSLTAFKKTQKYKALKLKAYTKIDDSSQVK